MLSALVSEVQALTRLINHRQFLNSLIVLRARAQAKIDAGNGDELVFPITITMKHSFFSVFESLTPKLGTLTPWQADRITRFYSYVKAVAENYDPASSFHNGLPAEDMPLAVENDIQLLLTAMAISEQIVRMVHVEPPRGEVDPFTTTDAEPELPVAKPGDLSKSTVQIETA